MFNPYPTIHTKIDDYTSMTLKGSFTAENRAISAIYGSKCKRKIVAFQWSNRRRNWTWNGWVTEHQTSTTGELLENRSPSHRNITETLVTQTFPSAHREGLPVHYLRCNFGCGAGCLRQLGRPWETEITFQALRPSLVDFSRSSPASNSEKCSIRCARPRAFSRKFWSPNLNILHQIYHNIPIEHSYCCTISWF